MSTTAPAHPLLASSLTNPPIHSPLPTLSPLTQRGRILALSGPPASARAVAQDLLVAGVVAGAAAAVVDGVGAFDVLGLCGGVGRRMGEGEGNVEEVLRRVRIMRVFDFEGVREAVEEVRGGMGEGRRKRVEVPDSEDEDGDGDEEMLFDIQDPVSASIASIASGNPRPQEKQQPTPPQPTPTILLIDNLAHILTPLQRKDSIQGTPPPPTPSKKPLTPPANTLATTFLTHLAHLTRTHGLCTILLNPDPSARAPHGAAAPQIQRRPHPTPSLAPPSPSIFASRAAAPPLLGLLARYADAHVLVGAARGTQVLEVVADRWGDGVGRWGVLGEGGGEAEGGFWDGIFERGDSCVV